METSSSSGRKGHGERSPRQARGRAAGNGFKKHSPRATQGTGTICHSQGALGQRRSRVSHLSLDLGLRPCWVQSKLSPRSDPATRSLWVPSLSERQSVPNAGLQSYACYAGTSAGPSGRGVGIVHFPATATPRHLDGAWNGS